MPRKGRVYLVGAGPGDPELLTLKAKRLLEEAELVIYDYLANPAHLRHAKEGSRQVCVGKRFRHHPFSQNKINQLIIQAARKGKTVVRLKGGDPYLFGRGAEEALYLKDRGVSFEVVPGVTSATACAAYSGIPLTHRDHNASVTFLTGHRAHDENLDTVDWEKIVSLSGTIVIYMGFYNLEKITQKLMQFGMSGTTRISIIEWGTLPKQKSCDGVLQNIVHKVKEQNLNAPAMIIIGDVVRLKEKLNWFERLPLFGQKIVVTRAAKRNQAFQEKLEQLGAEVIEFPTVTTSFLSNYKTVDAVLKNIKIYDWLIFTSACGIEAFMNRVFAIKKDARFLAHLKIAVVGTETLGMLKKFGLNADLVPTRFEALAIAEEMKKRFGALNGKKILLARTSIATDDLPNALKKLGAKITKLAVYKTTAPKKISKEIRKRILGLPRGMVTFTSSSTVDQFVKIMGRSNINTMIKKTAFASIGPVTSATLRKERLPVSCEAKNSTLDGLLEAVLKFYKK